MKKHNTIALLLTLTMLLALLGGCGGSASQTAAPAATAAPAPASPAPETPAEAPAEAPAPETPPDAAPDAAPADGEAVDPAEASIDSSALYPVFDELTTITAFLNIAPWASAYIGDGAQFENAAAILAAEEYTNVHLDVTWSDPDTYTEKVNIMLAGGDYPNILRDFSGSYNGGTSGIIEDGICVDLLPLFEEYAPEYYALLKSSPSFWTAAVSTEDTAVSMRSYTELPLYTRGPIVRKDMLDAVGMEIPTTVSELHDVALALKNNGVEFPVVSPSFLVPAYDSNDLGGSNPDFQITWLAVDGEITPALALDSQLEYITEMKKWVEEGLFVEDWYNPLPWYDNYVLSDRLAIAKGPYSITSTATLSTALNPDVCQIYPMANVTVNEGDTIRSLDNTIGGRGDGDWCITNADEAIVPQIVSYVNWFFTEQGSLISNFGIENESFVYDENGDVQYTDLILKDPNGFGTMAVYAIYTNNNDNPFYYRYERTSLTYDNEVEATVFDTWLSNITSEYYVNAPMTSEETSRYNEIASDIKTMVSEKLTMFITGDVAIEEWDGFIQSLYDLGLNDLRDITQTAYDRQLAW